MLINESRGSVVGGGNSVNVPVNMGRQRTIVFISFVLHIEVSRDLPIERFHEYVNSRGKN